MNKGNIVDDIALTFEKGVNNRTITHLISVFGSATEVYRASEQELLERAEIKSEIAKKITLRIQHGRAESELRYCEKHRITPIASTGLHYPPLLKECDDRPHVLYVIGNIEALVLPMISMVGTRDLSKYGHKMADRLVMQIAELAPQTAIVSGLAFGIDVACHRAALQYGLKTIAILPSTLPEIVPAHHVEVAREIFRNKGAIVSEMSSTAVRHRGIFPQRNRIIAGMSAGTLILESKTDGGSMITAQLAYSYQRPVMAVPGRADDNRSEGPNRLINQLKAQLVTCGHDIIRELGWSAEEKPSLPEADIATLSQDQAGLLSLFPDKEPVTSDYLSDTSGISISEILVLLFELESMEFIKSLPGNRYERSY